MIRTDDLSDTKEKYETSSLVLLTRRDKLLYVGCKRLGGSFSVYDSFDNTVLKTNSIVFEIFLICINIICFCCLF